MQQLYKKMGGKGLLLLGKGMVYPTERRASLYFKRSGEDHARAVVDEFNELFPGTETAARFARLFSEYFNNLPKIDAPSKPA
ncbi:hypothetical protein [Zoogloea dura]|uniref:Uncharacterized protein n=1 Tax=Zoogloea dura TaxID=2728840 RepID=A0A848G5L8_9RHOO|nr:hypothetical protein [Zoogloea dura]NML27528.1 hypothetical protein [Zoogloea dura]